MTFLSNIAQTVALRSYFKMVNVESENMFNYDADPSETIGARVSLK